MAYKVANQIKINEDKEFVYLEPLIRARDNIRNWTKNNMLRTPSFDRFLF